MSEDKGLIDERMEETWSRTQKFLEEGTFEEHIPQELKFFSRDVLPPLAARAFFKGVGNLDEKAADIVLKEVGSVCGSFELMLMSLMGFTFPTDNIDAFLAAHERGENVASGGLSKITRDGDKAATLVIKGGCVCPLFKTLQIDPTPNHCICTQNHLRHVYETGLHRPVKVDLIETYLRGGDSCTIRMSWD